MRELGGGMGGGGKGVGGCEAAEWRGVGGGGERRG